MILPTKHIATRDTLIGIGGKLLERLSYPKTISKLWDDVKSVPSISTFERFILGMDFLFILGLISFEDGKARKV